MIIQSIYLGTRRVVRIYQNRKIVWPLGAGEISLDILADIFSAGFHALTIGSIVALVADNPMMSVPDANLSALPPLSLHGESESWTEGQLELSPVSVVTILCDASSATRAELELLAANAISLSELTDNATTHAIHALVAEAVCGDHEDDMATAQILSAAVPDAVHGDHEEVMGTTQDIHLTVPGAAALEHMEDSGTQGEATLDAPSSVTLAASLDSNSTCEAHVLPLYVGQIATMDAELESETAFEGGAMTVEPVLLGALLRLVTTCEANLTVAAAACLDLDENVGTSIDGALDFNSAEGEEPEVKWFDPVQTGTNLYIRSVDTVWTDGNSANIDTEFFLNPIKEGNNLYIRQDIFGGE